MTTKARDLPFRVDRWNNYKIRIEWNGIQEIGEWVADLAQGNRVVILADPVPWSHFGLQVQASFAQAGVDPRVIHFRGGETGKSWEQTRTTIDRLVEEGFQRRDLLVLLGGGVMCDAGGFVASCFMRGVPYAIIPTTLMGQVDAAIGGKVAVNHPEAKNLIGSFHHPVGVNVDPCFLRTLPKTELRNGFGEMVKVALIDRMETFELMEREVDSLLGERGILPSAMEMIHQAVRAKVELLAPDPFEEDLRRPLNLGHSIAHSLETAEAYRGIKHGYAVAVGVAVATRLSLRRGLLDRDLTIRVHRLLARAGLPTAATAIPAETVWRHMELVRRIRGGSLREVLPTGGGGCEIVDDLTLEEFRPAYAESMMDLDIREAACG